ncbi:hypothetical protein N0V90_004739 [Kalmusia sp. IMI 367209]|nr:hypothetical protein N0V90_004739 [Kalmusia sp. IMI 367209]
MTDRFGILNETETEALSLQNLLLEIDQSLRLVEEESRFPTNGPAYISPSLRRVSGVMPESSTGQQGHHGRKRSRVDVSSIFETDFSTLSTEASTVNPDVLVPETSLLTHDLSDLETETHPLPEQGHLDIADSTNADIMDFVSTDIDEDGLFQSLADLDSADWYSQISLMC